MRRGPRGWSLGALPQPPASDPFSWLPANLASKAIKAILSGPSGPTRQADQLSCPSTTVPWHPSLLSVGTEGLRLGSHQEESFALGWLTTGAIVSPPSPGLPRGQCHS